MNPVVAFLLFPGASGIGLQTAFWNEAMPLVWPAAGFALLILMIGRKHL